MPVSRGPQSVETQLPSNTSISTGGYAEPKPSAHLIHCVLQYKSAPNEGIRQAFGRIPNKYVRWNLSKKCSEFTRGDIPISKFAAACKRNNLLNVFIRNLSSRVSPKIDEGH